jgi:hypothetical protein
VGVICYLLVLCSFNYLKTYIKAKHKYCGSYIYIYIYIYKEISYFHSNTVKSWFIFKIIPLGLFVGQ